MQYPAFWFVPQPAVKTDPEPKIGKFDASTEVHKQYIFIGWPSLECSVVQKAVVLGTVPAHWEV